MTVATTTRSLDGDMTVDEFKEDKEWLRRQGISYADGDGDGYIIDDGEVDGLVEYSQKSLGLRIVAY
ncbi:hypothetical protein ABZP36_033401 [Zizania latifolia]